MWEKNFLPAEIRAGSLRGGSPFTECSTGVCASVDSSYITVNLIKYIVIPTEGILISWVRNKSFSLLLQMKTSTLSCRESISGVTGWPPLWSQSLQSCPLLLLLTRQVPRVEFQGWYSASWEGEGAWPPRSGPGPTEGLGRDQMVQRGQGPVAGFGPPFAPRWTA